MPKELQQIVAPERNAASRRRKTCAGDVDKHGAAAPRYSWSRIVINFDNEIIEAVIPAEPVAWFTGRPTEWPVIATVRRVLAPSVMEADAADREQRPRSRKAIGPPPQPDGMKAAGGRAAVAFTLGGFDPAAAERNTYRPLSAGYEPALRAPTRPGTDANEAKRVLLHPNPDSQPLLALVS